jgi:uncharacterized membrane protein YuzA (DUF378 family)
MRKVNVIDYISQVLLIVGGLNWGSVGLFNYNFVDAIFGNTGLTTIIYSLVGLSAVYAVYTVAKLSVPEERVYRSV